MWLRIVARCRQTLVILYIAILCFFTCTTNAFFTFDTNHDLNTSDSNTQVHSTLLKTPPTIDLLQLWHLINPPSDPTLHYESDPVEYNQTQSQNAINSTDSINRVSFFIPKTCTSSSFSPSSFSSQINSISNSNLSSFCLPSNDYECNQQTCKCINKSMITLNAPPIGQLCIPTHRKFNKTCLLNEQCANKGFTCEPESHLNGSTVLQQFVALFALRWRVALLAARAGLSDQMIDNQNSIEDLTQTDSQLKSKKSASKNQNAKNTLEKDTPNDSSMETNSDSIIDFSSIQHLKKEFPLNQLYNRLAIDFQAESSDLFPGRCSCPSGHFLSFALNQDLNGSISNQLHSLLATVSGSILFGLNDNPNSSLIGKCVRIRTLGESCKITAECSRADPLASCRRNKCTCRSGYIQSKYSNSFSSSNQLLPRCVSKKNAFLYVSSSSSSSSSLETPDSTLKLNLNHSGDSFSMSSSTNSLLNNSSFRFNCTPKAEILCIKTGKCICRPLRRHLQQNLVSIVWTMICLLSIILVLGSLLAKNRSLANGSAVHSNANISRPSNLEGQNGSTSSLSSLSLLGFLLGRSSTTNPSNLRSAAHQQLLAGCTPPPDFNEVMDQPPSYEEAVRMLQKTADLDEECNITEFISNESCAT